MSAIASPKNGMVLPDDDGTVTLVYHRDFYGSPDDIWSWLTEYDKLAQWIGQIEGVAGPGATVTFRSTTDRVGEGVEPRAEMIHIDVCRPPNRLALDWVIPGIPLARIEVDVVAVNRGTILRLQHEMVDETRAVKIGAGWHYLLDRLDAAHEARALPTWDGYVEALAPVYGRLTGR